VERNVRSYGWLPTLLPTHQPTPSENKYRLYTPLEDSYTGFLLNSWKTTAMPVWSWWNTSMSYHMGSPLACPVTHTLLQNAAPGTVATP
jgi:TorA maturation chaperone TorD